MRRFLLIFVLAMFASVIFGCEKNSVMPVSESVTPKPTAAEAATPVETPAGEAARLSLYAMSECPYGVPAEKVVFEVKQALGDNLTPRLVFIVDKTEEGDLTSLHGPTEVEKNMIQACVGHVVPDKQLTFVVEMNQRDQPWAEIAGGLQIDADAVGKCLQDGTGVSLLQSDFDETIKLDINSSPTIMLNDQRYRGGINSRDIFDAVCATFIKENRPAACDDPPDNLSRTNPAGSGSCTTGKTEGEKVELPEHLVVRQPFTHPVIYDPNTIDFSRMEEVIDQTKKVYPDVKIQRIKSDSGKGKKMIAKYKIKSLPAFLFPAKIGEFKNFEQMKNYLTLVHDMYVLDGKIGSSIFLERERIRKQIDIYYMPYSPKAVRILLDINDLRSRPDVQAMKVTIKLHPYALIEDNAMYSRMGSTEIEEMLRQLAIMRVDAKKIWPYLVARYENLTSSYWEDFLVQVDLDPAKIKRLARSEDLEKQLFENSNAVAELTAGEEIVFLFENREKTRIEGKDQFKKALFVIGKR